MLIPFVISAGALPFKWFHVQIDPATGQPAGDPIDVQALGRIRAVVQVESERPECLEVEVRAISSLTVDHSEPLGRFIPLSPGGPFRVSARLIGATGNVIATGGFLAIVVNDLSDMPTGDLSLALGPPEGERPAAPSLIEVVNG